MDIEEIKKIANSQLSSMKMNIRPTYKPKLRKQVKSNEERINAHEAWLLLNKIPRDLTTAESKKLNRWLYGDTIFFKKTFRVK